MKNLKQFLSEASAKGAVFTFGRFNPPTTGHELLVNKLVKSTRGNETAFLFTSHSQDKKKNPLSYREKIRFLSNFFGNKVSVPDSPARNVFDIAVYLYKNGYTSVRMVVGSDRVREFKILLNKYNGVDARHGFYKFDNIEVISAGERDPDSDDVTGMSASKMRAFAMEGDFDSFEKGVPSVGRKTQSLRLYNAIRKGMGISEETMGQTIAKLMSKTFSKKQYTALAKMVRKEMDKDKTRRHSAEYYAHKILRQSGASDNMDARALAHVARMAEELTEDELNEVAQDKDVKDKKGTQPKKYYSGLDKKTKEKRDAHFKKGAKKDDDDSSAYEPAPGDKDAKTKTSKHTKKFRDMYGEECWDGYKQVGMKKKGGKMVPDCVPEENEIEPLNEDPNKALKSKAEKSGISLSILKQVYKRGVAAWRTGHRPGTTPEQWGLARVNSFITKGKGTWGKADSDLASKVKGK